MKETVEKIVKALVGSPDLVEVDESGDGKNVRLSVRVAPDDYGRLIGREGRTRYGGRRQLHVAGQTFRKRRHSDLVED